MANAEALSCEGQFMCHVLWLAVMHASELFCWRSGHGSDIPGKGKQLGSVDSTLACLTLQTTLLQWFQSADDIIKKRVWLGKKSLNCVFLLRDCCETVVLGKILRTRQNHQSGGR